ncbi:adenine phosphoribosyltransferase [Microbispora rosea subsp. aerata]|nr:adenine phosphoribosyltransferase [Microbispora rosea]GGO03187.1 adenine phosphoribosyltransferase [Microbispora rosea subsp. aerata]GIH54473.1 adenine phosphoribosyltransferase [Microbispora rosea subsp. aerata]GLJ82739.1 adenine phosphoribosyltransferase [Microbispora rosea subsp. aerata]
MTNKTIGHEAAIAELSERVARRLRVFDGFPRPGIAFQDLCGVLGDPVLLRDIAALIDDVFRGTFDRVLAVEARGFVLGTALASQSGRSLVLARKAGKLPGRVRRVEYDLEYGSAALEVQWDALRPGDRVLVVDDLLATGGTLAAARVLVETSGAEVAGYAVIMRLDGLPGQERLLPHPLVSIRDVAV